jgi:hypothetical protein
MNQKNETQTTIKTKPEAETQPVSAKTTKPSTPTDEAGSGVSSPAKPEKSDTAGLSPEVIDLVNELRDTVKSLNHVGIPPRPYGGHCLWSAPSWPTLKNSCRQANRFLIPNQVWLLLSD